MCISNRNGHVLHFLKPHCSSSGFHFPPLKFFFIFLLFLEFHLVKIQYYVSFYFTIGWLNNSIHNTQWSSWQVHYLIPKNSLTCPTIPSTLVTSSLFSIMWSLFFFFFYFPLSFCPLWVLFISVSLRSLLVLSFGTNFCLLTFSKSPCLFLCSKICVSNTDRPCASLPETTLYQKHILRFFQ